MCNKKVGTDDAPRLARIFGGNEHLRAEGASLFVRLGSLADIKVDFSYVRFTPESRHSHRQRQRLLEYQ